MSYLVIDLQKDALDQSINTTNLLRKALVVAKKLKLADFETWINLELNGYCSSEAEIPDYRRVRGEVKAWNPYHGWMPVLCPYNEIQEQISKRKVSTSIAEIEHLVIGDSSSLSMTFPGEAEHLLGQLTGSYTQFQMFVSKSQFQGIIETVRTTILNWALELEDDGILGEQMVFTEKEKEIAVHKNYTVNNFYGDVNNSQIQQNSEKSTQEHRK